MSGVAAYAVGFILSWSTPRTHTHTRLQLLWYHAAMQMHITTSPSRHLHSHSYLRHAQHFIPELLAALIKMSPNTEVINSTITHAHTKNELPPVEAVFPPIQKQLSRKIVNFQSMINLIPKRRLQSLAPFVARLIKVFLNCVKPWWNYLSSLS